MGEATSGFPQLGPLRLTNAQRKVISEIIPELTDRLKLDEPSQRVIPFTLDEIAAIKDRSRKAIRSASTGMKRNSFRHVVDLADAALELRRGIGAIPVSERLYQFRITLKYSDPSIWRRIQTRDCTLDKLHEHIQTAMGWTNSHLHHFQIGKQLYGDPMLMEEDFDRLNYQDSTSTKLSAILPRSGERFSFSYEYDFGDSWSHQILFEGCLRAELGRKYPFCVEGERACPPEDSGGVTGYREFLKALVNPDHDRHSEFVRWIGGRFDAAAFDSAQASKSMKRGLPDWRSESSI